MTRTFFKCRVPVTVFSRNISSASSVMMKSVHYKGIEKQKVKSDLIGPADPVSNLRPVHFVEAKNETALEKQLRLQKEEVQKWNQNFWTNHNNKFFKQKQDFMKRMQSSSDDKKANQALTSDEMSTFYKNFLDNNWKVHLNYNKEWYKRNFKLLFLSYRVNFEHILRKFLS